MHASTYFTNLQTLLIVCPLVLLLIASIFKLDAAVACRKTRQPARSLVPVSQNEMENVMTDPDGRPWDQN